MADELTWKDMVDSKVDDSSLYSYRYRPSSGGPVRGFGAGGGTSGSGFDVKAPPVNMLLKTYGAMDYASDEISRWAKTKTLEDEAAKFPDIPNDPYWYNILVGGANAAGEGLHGTTELPFGALAKGPNRAVFRNGDIQNIRKAISEAVKKGLNVRVFGHSYGGGDVARLSREFPNVPHFAIDPVSWTERLDGIPDNLTILKPKSREGDRVFSTLATTLGGVWPDLPGRRGSIIRYQGGHTKGVSEAVNNLMARIFSDRVMSEGGYSEKKYKIPFGDFMNRIFRRAYPMAPELKLVDKPSAGTVKSAMQTVSDSEARRIDAEAIRTGIPAMRAPTRGEWYRRLWKSHGRISAPHDSTKPKYGEGNESADEMLGRRMNPMVVASSMLLPGGGVASTGRAALSQAATEAGKNVIAEGVSEIGGSTTGRTAKVIMDFAPVLIGAVRR